MISPYRSSLDALLRIDGVTLAMFVGRDDGMIVDCAGDTARSDAAAAFAAALFARAGRASRAAGIGEIIAARAEASAGHICVVGADPLALVVIARDPVNLGRLRLAMRDTIEGAR